MTNPILLDQARALRARAERTRRLVKAIDDTNAINAILSYADELEDRAARLEAKAHLLPVGDEADLAHAIHSELKSVRATVSEIQQTFSQPSGAAVRAAPPDPASRASRRGSAV